MAVAADPIMILSIPYSYQVMGYAPRRQKAEMDTRRGVVEVLVEEVDPADAPVAALWKRGQMLEHRGTFNDIVLRSHAGGLWVAVSQANMSPGRAPPPGPSGDALLAAIGEAGGSGNPFSHHASGMPAAGSPERLFRREVTSNRDEAEAAVRETAAGVVMIEGTLHMRCPEPVLVRRGNGYDSFMRELNVWWHAPHIYQNADPKDVYRLDEWDAYLADARRIAEDMERPCDLDDDLDWIDVRMPEAFVLPTEASALSLAVSRLYHEMGSAIRKCTETGVEEIHRGRDGSAARDRMAWDAPYSVEVPDATLVDAYVRLGRLLQGGLDEAAMEEVRDLATEFSGLYKDAREDENYRRWKYADVGDEWKEVAEAFRRWDARPERLRTSDMESLASLDV